MTYFMCYANHSNKLEKIEKVNESAKKKSEIFDQINL